jgi:hypothetical protein
LDRFCIDASGEINRSARYPDDLVQRSLKIEGFYELLICGSIGGEDAGRCVLTSSTAMHSSQEYQTEK